MSEIGNGYSWFKFDIDGWLSSPDILNMSAADEGVYIRLLATQGRDGRLPVEADDIAKKSGRDPRGIKRWLKKYGFLFPIIQLVAEAAVTLLEQPCHKHGPTPQRSCDKCASSVQQICHIPAANWMRSGGYRANPKLWNLSVESGKSRGMPLLEESKEELDLDLDLDYTKAKLTLRVKAEGTHA
jgi:hypothetical protein